MSAIGDYIHLTARGYLYPNKYGNQAIKNATEGSIAAISAAVDLKHKEIKTFCEKAKAQKNFANSLEDALSGLINIWNWNAKSGQSRPNSEISDEAVNAILSDLEATLIDQLGVRFQFNEAKIAAGRRRFLKQSPINVAGKTASDIVKQVETKFNKVTTILSQFTETQINKSTTLSNLQNYVNNIDKEMKQINNIIEAAIKKETGAKTATQLRKLVYQLKLNNFEQNGIIDQLNNILAILNFSTNSSHEAGVIGEELTAAVAAKLLGNAEVFTEKAVKDAVVVGGQGSIRTIDTKNFAGSDWQKILDNKNLQWTGKNLNVIALTGNMKVMDKMDVAITFNDNSSTGLSVKNYNEYVAFERGITLAKQTSLLWLLQNDNQKDFVNHWLNLNAHRVSSKSKVDIGYMSKLNSLKEQTGINQAMNKLLALKALVGNDMSKAPEVFVYIHRPNRGQPRVVIKTMDEMLDMIQNSIPAFTFRNDWNASGAQARIDEILAQLYKYKLTVKISPEQLGVMPS